MVFCFTGPFPESVIPSDCPKCRLEEYISHKIGLTPSEIEPERFVIVEAEAFRDLIVTAEITQKDIAIELGPHTLQNPECARLAARHCKLCQ